MLGDFALTIAVNRSVSQRQAPVLYNRVAILRRERGLSCEELADELHIHPSTLVALENGSYLPRLALALALGVFFEMPIEAFFSYNQTQELA